MKIFYGNARNLASWADEPDALSDTILKTHCPLGEIVAKRAWRRAGRGSLFRSTSHKKLVNVLLWGLFGGGDGVDRRRRCKMKLNVCRLTVLWLLRVVCLGEVGVWSATWLPVVNHRRIGRVVKVITF